VGNYNPNSPIILGEEWVPIRDSDLVYNQAVNSFEMGHAFTLTSTTQLGLGRFYINRFPDNFIRDQVFTLAVYPKGQEANSGPIRSVMIPCNNGGVTGASLLVASTVAEALWNPSSSAAVRFQMGGATARKMEAFFAVDQYSQLLQGKRILGLDFVSNIDTNTNTPLPLDPTIELSLEIRGESQAFSIFYDALVPPNTPIETIEFERRHLGDTNYFFGSTNTVTAITNLSTSLMPWTYNELRRFEATFGTGRLRIYLSSIADPDTGLDVFVGYGALEVFYCEERRLAVGSHIYQDGTTNAAGYRLSPYNYGLNTIQMYDLNANANPILPAGEYVVTLSQSNLGDDVQSARNIRFQPVVNAVQELYTLSPHEGVQVNIPFPLDTSAIGQTLTKETVHILPQISLHTTGGAAFTQVHAYGRQSAAQVYGSITATQEILDSAAGASFSYPWVRYYARRFGDTTVPLRLDSGSPTVSGSGMGVFLSPEEWDELPEIIDGWKQVTLRFPTAPTMGTGMTPTWRWSATGEAAGSRWEVLGCVAPALSGNPGAGTLFQNAPTALNPTTATYGAPSAGATVNEGWIPQYAPYVSATADDQTADAVLIFSQDPPAVSGFVVSTVTQPVSGIGLGCGLNPCAIPSAIYYNQLSWTPDTSQVAFDNFNRVSASGWGVMSSGQTWSPQGGVATDHTVNGTYGQYLISTTNSTRRDVVGSFTDTEVKMTSSVPVVATGATIHTGIVLRFQDTSNHYEADLIWNTDNTVDLRLVSRIGGTSSTLAQTTIGWYSAGDFFTIKARIDGSNIYAKAWKYDGEEPTFWQATAVSTTITAAGSVGVRAIASTGNTNTPFTVSFEEFSNTPVTSFVYEIQRADTVDTDWQTIMLGNPLVSGFNDYEARVGLVSSYRMREVNSYGFYGSWSSIVSATVTDPGLVAGCVNNGHVLILTTNSRQSGSANLAYLSVWDGSEDVDEDFTFPEASWVQLQAMYGKDFYTAFRPTERGGDRFQRKVLVQAAAISPETLADFTGIRDLAWDSVPYVCVRDEDGNRWFATIVVPGANVRLNRSLYTAAIDIIEITDTPTAVSP
jgi:hypothetical protein